MSHQLVLEVPETVYGQLADAARRAGSTPERIALSWLHAVGVDPVEQFVGAFRSSVPGWPEEHDKYIGEGLGRPANTSGS